jgi:hypothetical protein
MANHEDMGLADKLVAKVTGKKQICNADLWEKVTVS